MKRILTLAVAVVLLLALAVPAASAANSLESYPLTIDNPIIITNLNTAVVSPINPMAMGASLNVEYYCSSKLLRITHEYQTVTYNGVSYPNVKVARVTGLVPGTYTVEARMAGSEITLGSVSVTVRSSVATGGAAVVTASSTNLNGYGSTTQLYVPGDSIIACGIPAADQGHFSVTNSGLVTCLLASGNYGYTDVSVYTASGKYGEIRIYAGTFPTNTVAVTKTQLNIGETAQAYLLDGSQIVSCSSTNSNVASVTNSGLITARTNGTVQVYVMSQQSAGVITITVGAGSGATTGGATLTKSTIAVGETAWLMAGSDIVTSCTSSNPAVATATNSGQITGMAAGTALLTYATRTGKTGSVTITVTGSGSNTGSDSSLPAPSQTFSTSVGKAKLLSMSNLTRVWAADESIAAVTISGTGSSTKARVVGLKAGSTTIYLQNSSTTKALTVNVSAANVIGSTGKIASGDTDLKVIARKSASSSGKALATLSNNVKVTIAGESGDYYKVTFKSGSKTYTGYVKKQFVAF